MLTRAHDPSLEHPADVLAAAIAMAEQGDPCALAMMTGAEGGAVRAPGALMAVSESGAVAGYVSGGCVDADVAFQARETLKTGRTKTLRYGAGSPFMDIKLPCGGAIEVTLTPNPDIELLSAARDRLEARKPARLNLSLDGLAPCAAGAADWNVGWRGEVFSAAYEPKPALRIAGRGADLIAMARLAEASGITCRVQSPDEDCLAAAESCGVRQLERLTTPTGAMPDNADDPWTAFALMFHDPYWEAPLLMDALAGPAFFVGAVGSSRTQARRREALAAAGLGADEIARVRGPIGLVPSMRDASMLAVSALAEIVAAFHARTPA
ncbi:MAG: XdhC family protein [Pseudomonadota bacterium]